MDLNTIRSMNDKDLRNFLNNLSKKGSDICMKCENYIGYGERKTINVGIYSPTSGQKVRKLCGLCNDCYIDLLDYLGIADIDWEG